MMNSFARAKEADDKQRISDIAMEICMLQGIVSESLGEVMSPLQTLSEVNLLFPRPLTFYLRHREIGPFVIQVDDNGETPLHRAAANGSIDAVKLLIDAGKHAQGENFRE